MKTLDDAVIELSGAYPDFDGKTYEKGSLYVCGRSRLHESAGSGRGGYFICEKEQFQQRAKELGFVGRYRWGVEYPTDGKRPDLEDDVVVQCVLINKSLPDSDRFNPVVYWDWSKLDNDTDIESFKITDQRYKPVNTGYLVAEFNFEALANQFDSSDDINAVWALRDKLILCKAKAERKRVVDAAFASLSEFRTASQVLEELYDKSFLRMPENK